MQLVKVGSRGDAVKLAQQKLNEHGYSCDVDGIFGRGTEAVTVAFQRAKGLDADGIIGRGTWAELMASSKPSITIQSEGLPPVMKKAQELGHQVWDTPYRLWLFGIRSPSREANAFDDTLGCAWFDESGTCNVEYWPGTTDPGTYWLENPSKSSGTAILVEGQYLDVWKIDKHGGKYTALCQRNGEVRVYRDANRDNHLDMDPATIVRGLYGINLHAATQRVGGESTQVNKWSAGCQVHATQVGFSRMMELAHLQVEKTGRATFSYTLLDEW